jgi:hypothetical protein
MACCPLKEYGTLAITMPTAAVPMLALNLATMSCGTPLGRSILADHHQNSQMPSPLLDILRPMRSWLVLALPDIERPKELWARSTFIARHCKVQILSDQADTFCSLYTGWRTVKKTSRVFSSRRVLTRCQGRTPMVSARQRHCSCVCICSCDA